MFSFGTEEKAEAARQLCVSHFGATFDARLGPQDSPRKFQVSGTTSWPGGKTLRLVLGFHDTLEDVKNAVLPLGATEVQLCKSSSSRCQEGGLTYLIPLDDRLEAGRVEFPSEESAQAAVAALQTKTLRDGGPPTLFLGNSEEAAGDANQNQNARTNGLWVCGLGRRTTKTRFRNFFLKAPGLETAKIRMSFIVLGSGTRDLS